MNKRKAAVCLGLCLAVGLMWCPPAGAAGGVKFYLGAEGVYSFSSLASGGFNTSGPFHNSGTDAVNAFRGGAHVGVELSGIVSLDFGFHYRGGLAYRTDSYVDPMLHYYYDTTFDANLLMFSVFISPFPDYAISPYVGAGLGAAMTRMSTDDTVVNGSVDKTNLAWHLEAGLELKLTDNIGLKFGYRYLSLGTDDLALYDDVWGSAAGNFTGAVKAHEAVLAFLLKL